MGEQSLDNSGQSRPRAGQQSMSLKRSLYLDQIKAVIVALVIAIHVPMAFSVGWFGVHIPVENSVGSFFNGFFAWYAYAINSFIMPMMFLISGYFVPRSVHKKGVVQYLKTRLVRLGVPFLVGLLLINNAAYLIGRLSPSSPLAELSWNDFPFNRVWVLWFLVVLFGFDLLYCAWVALRGDRFVIDVSIPVPRMRSWLITAVVLGILEVAMGTQASLWGALMRSPWNGLGAQGMHLFPSAVLFFHGCKASFHQWFERLDSCLVVKWLRFSVFILLGFLGLFLTLAFNAELVPKFQRIAFFGAFSYPFIAWGLISCLILWFQRHGHRFGQWLAVAGVNSYGAYVIHSLVLVVVLLTVGFIGINPWFIAQTATLLTSLISFGLAGQLRRIPVVARIL